MAQFDNDVSEMDLSGMVEDGGGDAGDRLPARVPGYPRTPHVVRYKGRRDERGGANILTAFFYKSLDNVQSDAIYLRADRMCVRPAIVSITSWLPQQCKMQKVRRTPRSLCVLIF